MRVIVEETPISGVLLVSAEIFEDHRGFFTEVFRQDTYRAAGLPDAFVQLNLSRSRRGVVRGLHFQFDPPMGKLMRVAHGAAYLVAVDLRKGSPTLGKWYGLELDDSTPRLLWAPASFARGFCVLSDVADIEYFTTGIYNAPADTGIRWNDPAIGIEWPEKSPILSDKDRNAQTLAEWLARPESDRFRYNPEAGRPTP
jgi:dTDP-4-dehydrorhamnose 3,5-epimerase